MNVQPHRPAQPDALERLCQLWELTPANAALARAYLGDDRAEDSLLSGAERQLFPLDWWEQRSIIALLRQLAGQNRADWQAKVLKLLWAMGGSTAGFVALFDDHCTDRYTASDADFDLRCQVLGSAAAAAMDAECPAARPIGYAQTKRLHRLARTHPEALLEAQCLIADPQNSMAAGVLAGVLLAAGSPEKKRPGLLAKLPGGASGRSDSLLEGQAEVVLSRVEAILTSEENILLSGEDASHLTAYLRAGDPTAPVPATSSPNSWQSDPLDYFSCLLVSISLSDAVRCLAPAALFGLDSDPRLACAMRVLAGVDPCGALLGVIRFLPEDWEMGALDALLPHIPGGGGTLLRFVVSDFYGGLDEKAKKLARHFRAAGEEILNYLNLEGYERLGAVLPELKHSRDSAWMEHLQGVITPFLEKLFDQEPQQQDIVHSYLAGEGAFADSAALLRPIRNEYRYLSNISEAVREYRKLAGWDDYACRCMVLFCLICAGNGTSKPLSTGGDQKQNLDAFVDALMARGLPVRDCMSVLTLLHQNWYGESREPLEQVVGERFVTPAKLEELGDAARNSCAAARAMAVEGLEALSSRPDCAEGARRALIACAGDTSKQVQELLVQRYIRHPEWEADYLVMLGSKKTAQRSLAIRILAGIGVERYRDVLERALAAEKNAKVMDQIAALLKTPAAPADGGEQTPAELAAQVLKGGKKRKVQWLLDQPLPTVRRRDEAHTAASEDQIAALFVAYAELGRMGRSDTAAAIAADLNGKDLEALACEVWELWMKEGAQSKTKWVLSFAAVFGGAAMTPKFLHAIRDWPENARGAIACDAVAALTVSPDPAALMEVDGIARKFKFRQVKAAAAAALERAAQELGITAEELADRIVPTLGFAADGTRVFDYGPRRFTVRLTPSLELAVTTEAGKTVKSMPSPGKTDDMEKARAAYEAYKALKKQIKTTAAAQRARLELALSVQRCWDSGAWRKLFVENPVMHQFAISLIWGVYENGGLKETFRYMEDGSFNTADEEEYTLPDGAGIGLVHPIELEEDVLAAWKQQLEDYEITQSIDQLSRPIFRLPEEQARATALETAGGRVLNALTLAGKLQSMGWYRGSILDGGGFYTFYREDPSVGVGVVLSFSGSFVGGDYSDVTVFDAVFYRADIMEYRSFSYDTPDQENTLPLGQVPARYYSEVVWQLERATASSTKTDPNWRSEKG